MNYIDIHTHSFYMGESTTIVLNVFPGENQKFDLPSKFSVGLHPWHIREDTWEMHVDEVKELCQQRNVIAVGETGLDKAIGVPYAVQRKVFEAQLQLAESLHMPLIIHCVRSYSEMLEYRKHANKEIPWIFHWFNNTIQMATELINKNCYLSFGHMLFNEQSRAFQVFNHINPGYVFFETDDAGYSIGEVYNKAAAIKHLPEQDLVMRIQENFNRCFNM